MENIIEKNNVILETKEDVITNETIKEQQPLSAIFPAYSNNTVNTMAQFNYSFKKDTQLGLFDSFTNERKIEKGNLIIRLNNEKDFRLSTNKLLDYINILFAEKQSKVQQLNIENLKLAIDIKEYMRIKGKSEEEIAKEDTYKNFRKVLKEDLDILYNASVEGVGADGESFKRTRIITDTATNIYGGYEFNLAPELANHIHRTGGIMLYPKELLQIDEKKEGLSYKVGRALSAYASMHNNIKISKKGWLCIKVDTLINKIDLPITSRKKGRDIINPLEEALDKLNEMHMFMWEYCGSKQEPLSKEDRLIIEGGRKYGGSFDSWRALYIKYKPLVFDIEKKQKELIQKEQDRKNKPFKKRKKISL